MGFKQFVDAYNKKMRKEKNRPTKSAIIGAGIGTALGVITGLLFAPKSGKETREEIGQKSKEAYDTTKKSVKTKYDVAKEKLENFREKLLDDDSDCCGCGEKGKSTEEKE